jgi:adenosylmethionine-8-amino-7-oxononanoate aminotransferase
MLKKQKNNNWLEDGYKNIWLPYAQMKTCNQPLPVVGGLGSKIFLEDGSELIDGISSWWSVCHGYQHPYIVEKIKEQADKLCHVMFAGLAHEQGYSLAKRLASLTPEGLNKVFFSESGSAAVEIAMKMCVQFWHNKGNKIKNKFISFKDGYHGETMGALSLGDPEGWTAKAFNKYCPKQFFVDVPRGEYSFSEFEEMLNGIKKEVAGIIIEPLVQGAGGMKFHAPDTLAEIYRIAKKHDILFIADEIMTGFYRTGNKFACEEAGITPDIMCVGKALSGGMLPLAATIATDEIFEEFLDDSFDKAFLHGPTFMANPLACAAANASLDLFEKENIQSKIDNIEKFLIDEFEIFKGDANILDVRVKGAIGVIQFKPIDYDLMWKKNFEMRQKFVDLGVWLRPFKDVLYVAPNFNITQDELEKIGDAIEEVVSSRV